MAYRFRLTFHHHSTGLFRFEENSLPLVMDDGTELTLVARDADELRNAAKFHFDSAGYPNEQKAREAGERLRSRLKVINCALGLGMTIPTVDGNSGFVSEEIKEKAQKSGGVLLDTIVGLKIYPDDGTHLEFVSAGKIKAYPSDPLYVLKGLKQIWDIDIKYDDQAGDALEILSLATKETSPKTKFLTTYLAMERLIETEPRTDSAQLLIDNFIEQVKKSHLKREEVDSLVGSLGHLKRQSFSSAFSGFAKRISNPKEINGTPVQKFVSECISARNRIAHNATENEILDLNGLTKGLREMVLGIIWTRNKIPVFSIQVPADQVNIEEFEIKLL